MGTKKSTRELILDAAEKLLQTSGIQSLSQTAVAKMIGISQGQLTYHFQKRNDLMLALTDFTLDKIADYLYAHQSTVNSKSFFKLVELVLTQMKSVSHVRTILGLMIEADENEDIRNRMISIAQKVRKMIGASLEVDEDSTEAVLAHATMMGFSFMMFMQKDKDARKKLEEDFKKSIKILADHIQNQKKNSPKPGAKK